MGLRSPAQTLAKMPMSSSSTVTLQYPSLTSFARATKASASGWHHGLVKIYY